MFSHNATTFLFSVVPLEMSFSTQKHHGDEAAKRKNSRVGSIHAGRKAVPEKYSRNSHGKTWPARWYSSTSANSESTFPEQLPGRRGSCSSPPNSDWNFDHHHDHRLHVSTTVLMIKHHSTCFLPLQQHPASLFVDFGAFICSSAAAINSKPTRIDQRVTASTSRRCCSRLPQWSTLPFYCV